MADRRFNLSPISSENLLKQLGKSEAMNLKTSGEGYPGRLRGRKGKREMLELYYNLKNKFLKNIESHKLTAKTGVQGSYHLWRRALKREARVPLGDPRKTPATGSDFQVKAILPSWGSVQTNGLSDGQ